MRKSFVCLIALLALGLSAAAQQTQTLYLSGTGSDDTRTWQFRCSDGQNSGKWSTIEVPSQWELQGYGQYTYGFSAGFGVRPVNEFGEYRYSFKVPASWRGRDAGDPGVRLKTVDLDEILELFDGFHARLYFCY